MSLETKKLADFLFTTICWTCPFGKPAEQKVKYPYGSLAKQFGCSISNDGGDTYHETEESGHGHPNFHPNSRTEEYEEEGIEEISKEEILHPVEVPAEFSEHFVSIRSPEIPV